MKLYFFFLLLFPVALCGNEFLWQKEAPGGFSATVKYLQDPIELTDLLPVHLTLHYPSTHQIDIKSLQYHLLQHAGVGVAPFILDHVDEKSTDIETDITFWLDPQVIGKQDFSFWNIPFHPKDKSDTKQVTILSDVFSIEIKTPPKTTLDPLIAPLLPLSQVLPIDLTPENRRRYLANPQINQEEAQRNVKILREHEFSWLGLSLLLAGLLFALIPPIKQKEDTERKRLIEQMETKEKALQQLKSLKATLKEKDFLHLYADLTQVLRTYIEKTYQVSTNARTTEEFLQEMTYNPIFDPPTQEALKVILQSADRVKFGHETPKTAAAIEVLTLTYNFVNKA